MDSIEISVTPQFDGFVFSLRPSVEKALLKEFPQLSPIHAILVSYVENKRDILLLSPRLEKHIIPALIGASEISDLKSIKNLNFVDAGTLKKLHTTVL
jgi:hypothetical protein